MLILKYKKIGSACFVSHVDTLRTMGRIFARADIKTDFSEGFNPHALLFFSPPNAVGVESLCEYVAVSTADTDGFIKRFNKNAPVGFVAERVWITVKNPNLAKEINRAEYLISCKKIGTVNLEKLQVSENFLIEYKDKSGVKVKDYRQYVLSAETENDDCIKVLLKYGNENLRPDRFMEGCRSFFGLSRTDYRVVKTNVFVNEKNTDDFLDEFTSTI